MNTTLERFYLFFARQFSWVFKLPIIPNSGWYKKALLEGIEDNKKIRKDAIGDFIKINLINTTFLNIALLPLILFLMHTTNMIFGVDYTLSATIGLVIFLAIYVLRIILDVSYTILVNGISLHLVSSLLGNKRNFTTTVRDLFIAKNIATLASITPKAIYIVSSLIAYAVAFLLHIIPVSDIKLIGGILLMLLSVPILIYILILITWPGVFEEIARYSQLRRHWNIEPKKIMIAYFAEAILSVIVGLILVAAGIGAYHFVSNIV